MSRMPNFPNIQRDLIDPSAGAVRRRGMVCALATIGKILSAGCFIASSVITLASAISIFAHPILGSIGLAIGTLGMFLSHEAFVICRNIENASKNRNIFSNIAYVAMNALTPEHLTESMFKGTLSSYIYEAFKL